MYNEMAVLKLVTSMTRMVNNPCAGFASEIMEHMRLNAKKFMTRMALWRKISLESSARTSPVAADQPASQDDMPDFPLIPASKGFCLTLNKALTQFKENLLAAGVDIDNIE